jgi:ketosteroid isomerase-like protein
MKRVMILAGIVCVVFIASCGGGDSPSSVARKFYAAVEKNDAKAMGQVATAETVQMMAMFGEKAAGMAAANGKIKRTTEKIDGDTAVVTLVFENGETSNVDLKKVDGKWKVVIDK